MGGLDGNAAFDSRAYSFEILFSAQHLRPSHGDLTQVAVCDQRGSLRRLDDVHVRAGESGAHTAGDTRLVEAEFVVGHVLDLSQAVLVDEIEVRQPFQQRCYIFGVPMVCVCVCVCVCV